MRQHARLRRDLAGRLLEPGGGGCKEAGSSLQVRLPQGRLHGLVPRGRCSEGYPKPPGGYRLCEFLPRGLVGAQVAPQGYYSPTTTCETYLKASKRTDPQGRFNDYEWCYLGGENEEPKKGWPIRGRDTGSFRKRWSNVMHWMVWPDDADYYAKRWNDFLSA